MPCLNRRLPDRKLAFAVTEEKGIGLKGWLAGPGAKKPKTETPASLDKHRIAVLPLSNISPDPKDEYFADGISDELISTIAKVQGLRVIARTSSAKYKASGKGISEIGRELRSGSIVEGTVRKAGNRLRVTAQLVDSQSEESLWSETYDRELDDVFHIQADIARKVAHALQVKLLTTNRTKIEESPTTNSEAYLLYLQGRFLVKRSNEADYKQAINYFEHAIATDPKFALAYSGLAEAYSGLGFQGMMLSREARPKAREFAEKALELDNTLAEAHLVTGRILRTYDWDAKGAEKEYRRAIELNPSLVEAYTSNALLLMSIGQFEEAIAEAKRALTLDPLSGSTAGYAGTIFLYCGQYDDAVKQYTRALALDPEAAYAHNNLGLAYVQKGMFDKGIEEMQKARESKNAQVLSDLAYAYARAGRFEELREILKRSLSEVEKNPELALVVASSYANLGDRDRAIDWLERARRDHLASLVTINNNFVFEKIRSDPRFQVLLKKIGFTNVQ